MKKPGFHGQMKRMSAARLRSPTLNGICPLARQEYAAKHLRWTPVFTGVTNEVLAGAAKVAAGGVTGAEG